MTYEITIIPGDGIGPEVVRAAKRCVDALIDVEWDEQTAGASVMDAEGTPLPGRVLESIRERKVALKGPITTPLGSGFRSVNVAIRKALGLYANVRPARHLAGVQTPITDVDLVVVRENTEDLYAGIEFEAGAADTASLRDTITSFREDAVIGEDAGISIKAISEAASERIVRYAFEYAREHGRGSVTAVTKSNIMKHTDGLFQRVAERVAQEYPDVEFWHGLVDQMAMQLVQRPHDYDVLVMPNLYGDIISDLAAGLIGGLGVAPGMNVSDEIAVFEPVHGSAPKYAGQDVANPTAMIRTAQLMLEHLGESEAARRLEAAVQAVIEEGESVTYDLRADRDKEKAASTTEMTDAIVQRL